MEKSRLILIGESPRRSGRQRYGFYRCLCKKVVEILHVSVNNGHTKSCGCLRKEVTASQARRHGSARPGKKTVEYICWMNIRQRCHNPKCVPYQNYGARGITVCRRWRNSFKNFLADMGPKPTPKHSIERKNNDRGYSPSNCVWATKREQSHNTRRSRKITFRGRKLCMSEWAKEIGISWCGLDTRIRKYGVRKALSMAGKQKGNQRLVTFRGRTMNMTDWGKEIGVRPETIRRRIRLWGVKSALSNGKIRGSAKRK